MTLQELSEHIWKFGADRLLPTWCQSWPDIEDNEQHWTIRLMNFFWVDCPCCLMFRGITVGLVFGLVIGALGMLAEYLLLRS